MSASPDRWRVPLGGADCFLLAAGSALGRQNHAGLTVLRTGPGLDRDALRLALDRFAARHPLLRARVRRRWPFAIPAWEPDPARVPAPSLTEHPAGTDVSALCHQRMNATGTAHLLADAVPDADGWQVVLTWEHLLFDGRGAELMVQELAALAADAGPDAEERAWSLPSRGAALRELRVKAASFLARGDELRPQPYPALADWTATPGPMRHEVTVFPPDATAAIPARLRELGCGWVPLPFFLAAAFRAHAAALDRRGQAFEFLQAGVPVQARKPGARRPLFQNQVNQLPFSLSRAELDSLPAAVTSLRRQFEAMTRARVDEAFGLIAHAMRRLPPRLYLAFLRRQTPGPLTSFFHSHTGAFLPAMTTFFGAPLRLAWHVPSVCSPPGTGVFFNEHQGRLVMVLCWRDGAVSDAERAEMCESLRSDLGADASGTCHPPESGGREDA